MSEIRNSEFQLVTLGAVKSDGTPDIANVLFRFPVPHQKMGIRQAARADEKNIPGRSGKIKQAVGYEDTSISINMLLVDIEDDSGAVTKSARSQFDELQAAFRDRSDPVSDSSSSASTSYAVPTVFSIQSPLTDSCGIKTVLFKGLDVDDAPGVTDLEISINFVEFEPLAVQVEKRGREAAQEQENQQALDEALKEYNDAVGAQEAETGTESPLAEAFRAGKANAMGGMPQ